MTRREAPGRMRLLPWETPDDKPCYLRTDAGPDGGSLLSRMADETEEVQLAMGAELLAHAERMTGPEAGAGAVELRYLAVCLTSSLRDALRIAHSRGERVP